MQFDEFVARNPLSRFSLYTQVQVDLLREMSREMRLALDGAMDGNSIEASPFMRVQGLFWLWVLGAYEVTRTMAQYRRCFSPDAGNRITVFKQCIAALRVPFAKQEYAGGAEPVRTELSLYGVDSASKDFLYEVKGRVFGARVLLASFDAVIASIRPEDVLHDLRRVPRD